MKSPSHRPFFAALACLAFTTALLAPLPAQPRLSDTQATPPPLSRRAALADIIASADPALAAAREQLVAAARKDAQGPIIRRPRTLAELRATPRITMKYAEKPAHHARLDEAAWERFALSLGDANAASTFALTLPRLAAAIAITGDPALAAHLNAQLAELATWSPLQRPGWSGTASPSNDGAWLGTGRAVRAIVQTLEILPPRHLAPGLRQALTSRLEAEIAGIRDDWRERRNWFTRRDCAYSNQWVLPTEALILASLHTGLERHRDDYEFGIKNLLRSLDAQGAQGEFVEGLEYSALTLGAILSVARDIAASGDTRVASHPYLKKFPVWYVHHLQPGGFRINAFDAKNVTLDWKLLAQFVADTRDATALWALRERNNGNFGDTLPGLLARAAAPAIPSAIPPLHAHYPVATRINWRGSWDDTTASGFWMRGGHATDAHDHQDRGHVNFIIGKRPVLIEAGHYSYGIPEHPTHFRSVAGHNVLQVGDTAPARLTPKLLNTRAGQILDPAHRAAPLTVHRLDSGGGEVSMDGSACYATVERWIRHVTWDRDTVDIRDEVTLREPDIILFRWHLGEPAGAPQTLAPGRAQVGGILVTYEADGGVPLTALVQPM
ncbi:MAG: heparinase II/III-family protein, partial [Opitutaceae bacterium]|nr:heparinase II/III-family protein [Opitutaceae bacterium]